MRVYSSAPERSRQLLGRPRVRRRGDGSWEVRGAGRGGLYDYDEAAEGGIPGAGTVHHIALASAMGDHEAWRERAQGRRAPDAGDRPLLLPLDLLPRAERRAVRDRDDRRPGSPPTSRSSTWARSSRCRPSSRAGGPEIEATVQAAREPARRRSLLVS